MDFGVVESVRESYQGRLTLVATMLEAAQAKGLTTAAIGKFGAPSSRITSEAASSSMKMRLCAQFRQRTPEGGLRPSRNTPTPTQRGRVGARERQR